MIKGNCTVSASGVTRKHILIAPGCSIEYSSNDNVVQITVENTNSIPVTAYVSLFNANTNANVGSTITIESIGANSTSTVTVDASSINPVGSAYSVYATAYFRTNTIGYTSSSSKTTSETISWSKLMAPELISTGYFNRPGSTIHKYSLTLKNPNSGDVNIYYRFRSGNWASTSAISKEQKTVIYN